MSIHAHRNSFNAGEISPLMDARTDEGKHQFSCRVLENFIPKIYGGAFRRPGTLYEGAAMTVSEWTERTEEHSSNLLFGGDNTTPGAGDDETFYEVGSLWLKCVKTLYKCNSASASTASWSLDSSTHDLYGDEGDPDETFDGLAGWDVGSVIINRYGAAWVCTDNTSAAAVWELVTQKLNLDGLAAPGTGDNAGDGYAAGSYWVRNVFTLYECSDASQGAAVWDTVSGTHSFLTERAPLGSDDDSQGFAVGSIWIDTTWGEAWELTDAAINAAVRLIDFNVSATERRILELGDGYLRIWNDDGTEVEELVSTNPLVLQTPYSSSEIFEVQMAQLGNLAYFAHPNHPPQKVERSFSAGYNKETFAWSQVDWSFPAFRDTNITEYTASPSATSGPFSILSFTANPFTETLDYSQYTGARIMLSQRRDASQADLDLASTGNSSTLSILGGFTVYTYGAAVGTLLVQGKDKAGAWVTLKAFQFSGETDGRNIIYNSEVFEATDIRLSWTAGSGSTGTAYLEASDSRRVGYARILSGIEFSSSLPVVRCAVELDFDSTNATTDWAIEAWADYAGYPRSVCFHEQRLWFGGTKLQPNTIWASATGDFENFRRGSFDSDSLAFTLAAQEGSAIQSMVSHDALVIFTQSEEWTATTSENTAITPSNIFVRRQSRFGSAHRQAFVAANNLLFIQRGSRKLRQFSYSGGAGGQGQASDLTLLAEHVTQGGIKQIAFQQQPDPIIWCIRNDGVLLSLTYEADQNVIAWARHTSGSGLFESVAVTYGDDGEADEVWFIVNRGGSRYLERLDSEAFTKLENDDVTRMVYLDSAVLLERGSASTSVTGLSHLEGESVDILGDGAVQAAKTVASGAITLDTAAADVVAGIPYTSKLQPSKIEVQLQDGTAQGRKWVCKRASLNLWKSFGLEYGATAGGSQWFDVQGMSVETPLGDPADLTTGLVRINNLGAHGDSVDLTLRQRLPLPANVLAIIPKYDVAGT